MKLKKIVDWLDRTLKVADFDDVSNNGVQIARTGEDVRTVAFAVDASVRAVKAASAAGAELLVVHHGISWGGGIRRLDGGVYDVVRAAIEADLAVYACHLPLDAHPTLGNNAQLAKLLGLRKVRPAFSYHGNVIGLVGNCSIVQIVRLFRLFDSLGLDSQVKADVNLPLSQSLNLPVSRSEQSNNRTIEQSEQSNNRTIEQSEQSNNRTIEQSNNPNNPNNPNNRTIEQSNNLQVGICSGGAGEFAEEAKRLGCDLYLTGEASWGDVIAAENVGMKMVLAGHYATEVFGVRAVSKAMKTALKVKTLDLTEDLR